ncbi:MAG: MATE family efflux transporter, partial [Proteobacteria bacterium]|nr:MATE family efflux transporter [Pseudomonadota bacterium]
MQYHRQIQIIALPMILSSVSIPLLGIVDTAILGHLDSEKYLAAVSVGASIINILFWGFGFLRMSTTGLVAQSHGINNHQESKAHLSRAF